MAHRGQGKSPGAFTEHGWGMGGHGKSMHTACIPALQGMGHMPHAQLALPNRSHCDQPTYYWSKRGEGCVCVCVCVCVCDAHSFEHQSYIISLPQCVCVCVCVFGRSAI